MISNKRRSNIRSCGCFLSNHDKKSKNHEGMQNQTLPQKSWCLECCQKRPDSEWKTGSSLTSSFPHGEFECSNAATYESKFAVKGICYRHLLTSNLFVAGLSSSSLAWSELFECGAAKKVHKSATFNMFSVGMFDLDQLCPLETGEPQTLRGSFFKSNHCQVGRFHPFTMMMQCP